MYSVLARYYRHTGSPSINRSNHDLFGRFAIRATFDLPNYLHLLARKLIWPGAPTLEELATGLTHINYYTAFLPSKLASKCRKIQLEGKPNLHLKLGVNSSVVRRKEHLAYCPDCCREMMAAKGEMWWRLDHQLPGVVVCSDHSTLLLQSDVHLWSAGAHGFVAATEAICPDVGEPLIKRPPGRVLQQLIEIAVRSAALLNGGHYFQDFEELTDFYRGKLFDKGMMLTRKQIDVAGFQARFRTTMGPVLSALSDVFGRETSEQGWVMELARKQASIKHPLQHIIFQIFLDGLKDRDPPFGAGPWKCLSPVAHAPGKAMTIENVEEKNTRAGVTGTFRCTCGYAYTMTRLLNGRLAGPRFKEYGPLLDPTLIELVHRRTTLRGAAKVLGLHPCAAAQAAARLGLNTGWKAKPLQGPRLGKAVHQPPKSRSRGPRTSTPGPSKARIDWVALDQELLPRIQAEAAAIRAMYPPVKVARIEIERRLKGPNYLTLRRAKLPQSVALATSLIEDTEQFRARRLDMALARMTESTVPLYASTLLREAGLPSSWMGRVRAAIADLGVQS
jgi:hypothetical protein